MSLKLLPVVRLVLPCESAVFDGNRQGYVISVPLHAVGSAPDAPFPVTAPPFFCYVQLTDAVGTFRFSITVMYEGSERVLYRTKSVERTFTERGRLGVADVAFVIRGVTFPRPGLYPIHVTCDEILLDSGDAAMRVWGGNRP
jgi:hypothetical protein